MIVLNQTEMAEFDDYTLKSLNISEIDLMKKAGEALTLDFLSRVKPLKSSIISIFSGVGNNGGDALVMLALLKSAGYSVNLYIVGDLEKASEAFRYFYSKVENVLFIDDLDSTYQTQNKVYESEYIIDGIFGNGLIREVKGYRKDLFEYINSSKSIVYSIDLPSGINPNNGKILGTSIKANYTGVLGFYKIGNLINDALDYHGKIKVLDIGIVQKFPIYRKLIDVSEYKLKFNQRKHNSNKYTNGFTLFIGGKKSMMGSIQMSAISGMKSGLGIAIIISDLSGNFTQLYPELIIVDKFDEVVTNYLEKSNSIVFGPGLEKNDEIYKDILGSIINSDKKIVIDASGLKYINVKKKVNNPNVILTPHIGELANMFGLKSEEITNDPLKYIGKLTDLGYNVLLKGPCTILANKNQIKFIQAKNKGLATAGSGDVLAGIIGAMSIDLDALDAMEQSVIIHSRASYLAKDKYGERSLLASNIIEFLSEVIKEGETNEI